MSETDKPEHEQTLLSLPDVPLLKVLAYLRLQDLGAAGLATPRLGALTRTHSSLWRRPGKDKFESVESVADLLPVAPPTDRLKLDVDCYVQGVGASFEGCDSELVVQVPAAEDAARLIPKLAPSLRHLNIFGLEIDELFHNLKAARRIETLRANVLVSEENSKLLWPKGLVLASLHTLELECDEDEPGEATLRALRSMLRALSGLRSLKLTSAELLPILDACPSGLRRLDVKAGEGVAKALRRLRGQLRELRIKMTWPWPHKEEVDDLLKSWSGPLERLELIGVTDSPLRLDGLPSLQDLVLHYFSHFPHGHCLAPTLAGLTRLRSLALLSAPPPAVLHDISCDVIPALELLVVGGIGGCGRSPCHCEDCPFAAKQDPVQLLEALVRRAPQPLHAVSRLDCNTWSGPRLGWRVMFAHPEGPPGTEAETDCRLCRQAAEAARFYSPPHRPIQVRGVQVR